jgi:hypothetical protein
VLLITIRAVLDESPVPSDIVTVAEIMSVISKPPPGGWPAMDPSALEVHPAAAKIMTKPSVRMPPAEQATRQFRVHDFAGLDRRSSCERVWSRHVLGVSQATRRHHPAQN